MTLFKNTKFDVLFLLLMGALICTGVGLGAWVDNYGVAAATPIAIAAVGLVVCKVVSVWSSAMVMLLSMWILVGLIGTGVGMLAHNYWVAAALPVTLTTIVSIILTPRDDEDDEDDDFFIPPPPRTPT